MTRNNLLAAEGPGSFGWNDERAQEIWDMQEEMDRAEEELDWNDSSCFDTDPEDFDDRILITGEIRFRSYKRTKDLPVLNTADYEKAFQDQQSFQGYVCKDGAVNADHVTYVDLMRFQMKKFPSAEQDTTAAEIGSVIEAEAVDIYGERAKSLLGTVAYHLSFDYGSVVFKVKDREEMQFLLKEIGCFVELAEDLAMPSGDIFNGITQCASWNDVEWCLPEEKDLPNKRSPHGRSPFLKLPKDEIPEELVQYKSDITYAGLKPCSGLTYAEYFIDFESFQGLVEEGGITEYVDVFQDQFTVEEPGSFGCMDSEEEERYQTIQIWGQAVNRSGRLATKPEETVGYLITAMNDDEQTSEMIILPHSREQVREVINRVGEFARYARLSNPSKITEAAEYAAARLGIKSCRFPAMISSEDDLED